MNKMIFLAYTSLFLISFTIQEEIMIISFREKNIAVNKKIRDDRKAKKEANKQEAKTENKDDSTSNSDLEKEIENPEEKPNKNENKVLIENGNGNQEFLCYIEIPAFEQVKKFLNCIVDKTQATEELHKDLETRKKELENQKSKEKNSEIRKIENDLDKKDLYLSYKCKNKTQFYRKTKLIYKKVEMNNLSGLPGRCEISEDKSALIANAGQKEKEIEDFNFKKATNKI